MTKPIDDGGPAFPCEISPSLEAVKELREAGFGLAQAQKIMSYSPGMSVRTWLAGMAMQGICANVTFSELIPSEKVPTAIALRSVELTDALISALKGE